jgi:hypothetical protein
MKAITLPRAVKSKSVALFNHVRVSKALLDCDKITVKLGLF